MRAPSHFSARWLSFSILISLVTGLAFTAQPPRLVVFAQDEQPEIVVIPGTHQSELGCSADWQADCENTALVYDPEDDVWQGTFLIQPENDQDKKGPRYKAALNRTWVENYGVGGQIGSADIPLVVSEPTQVKFYFDYKSHWITDNVNSVIATVVGSFQSELGCKNDLDPGCLRTWMQDADGDGVYVFATQALPAGDYDARVAIDEGMDESYGAADGANITFNVPAANQEIYFGYNAIDHTLLVSAEGAPRGDLGKAQAHWVLGDTIAWQVAKPVEGGSFALVYAPAGELKLEPGKITGGESLPLQYTAAKQADEVSAKYPHLASFASLKLDAADLARVPEILRGQMAVVAFNPAGKVVDATSLQIAGVLDDLYAYQGALGVSFEGGLPTLTLWAPTARSVKLLLFADPTAQTGEALPMTIDPASGVWSIAGESAWKNKYYLYEVEVYVPQTGRVELNRVTDPYAISLSLNSQRSQIVDLEDTTWKPEGWDSLEKPPLAAFEDAVIYELHIRDFSANDSSIPEALRGGYLAFTQAQSNGMQHLTALAQAGLTHIHLLPAFDLASIEEDKSLWKTVDPAILAGYPGDSTEQAIALQPFRDQDGFNWGYDPYHYSTPEGSYASDPNSPVRILEFRQMVQALNQSGLRVVMDVVYNHTNASGQSARSVLDKAVPGYYHRLNGDGFIERSTCCENTATENVMMEKLMIDSLVVWAKYYKVDGFRFDLMGHHMLDNMLNVRKALDTLTPEKDGVDGSRILIYGEGWDFGEVAKNARGTNATQLNLGGTGIATFSDRLRDGVRGGGPFNPVQEQGFITGLLTAPNTYDQGKPTLLKGRLLLYMDWIRLGLAGNLKDFQILDARGNLTRGEAVSYNGSPAGYTQDPQEQIVYISAHDNETLFDAIQYKTPPETSGADRTRINNLGVSLVMLSQGIPFFHAGDDLLRSKSLDGNSYNSGDWYNRIDFTYQSNNWAVGLPDFRQEAWDVMRSMFANPNLRVTPQDIQFASAHFRAMLQMRKSSPLFRLQTAEQISQRLTFLDNQENRLPGLVVMQLDDTQGIDLDPNYEKIIVAFNALPETVNFTTASLRGLPLELHPLQSASGDVVVREAKFDPATGMLSLPGRTTVVFVLIQTVAEVTATPTAAPTATAPAQESPTPLPAVQPLYSASPTAPVSPVRPPGSSPALPIGIVIAISAAILSGLAYFWRKNARAKS